MSPGRLETDVPDLSAPLGGAAEEPALANSRWRVVGALAPGTSHARLGLPCQDALAYQTGEHSLLVALSDGAGTAERSQYGAQTAVQAALDSLAAAFDGSLPCGTGWLAGGSVRSIQGRPFRFGKPG